MDWVTFREDLRQAWKSWTVVFNTVMLIATAAMVDPTVRTVVEKFIGPEKFLILTAVVNLVNIALRFKTQGPLRDK